MQKRTKMKTSSRLLILLCLMFAGLMASTVLFAVTQDIDLLAMLTVQDVFVFILPALIAMAIFYRHPMQVMGMNRAPSWASLGVIVLFCIVSLPAMNWLVDINESMKLPAWMSGIEHMMRAMEDGAADTTRQLLDIHSLGQFLYTLLVVGFMAGLSEEILFRGAMLRTMQDSRLGKHAVVWITAIIFSALHVQFYGFLPRMLLGVWLGYLLVWTGSLWVPIIAHTLNNSIVVIFSYLTNKGLVPEGFGDHLGLPAQGGFPWLAVISLIASIALVIWANNFYLKKGK